MRRLTLGFLTLADVPPTELVEVAHAAGFRSVGLRITGRRPADSYHPVVGSAAAIRLIRSQLAVTGLHLSNISSYHLYPDVGVATYRPVLETVAELGAHHMVCGCYDEDEARFTESFARLCEEASSFGVRLSLEFVPFSRCPDLPRARRIVAATDGRGALLLDSLHLQRSGGSPADLAGLAPSWLAFAQLCDAPAERPAALDLAAEARTGRLYPGDGALPLAAFLDALPADIEIELETPVAAVAGLPAPERAREAYRRGSAYLSAYDARRGAHAG